MLNLWLQKHISVHRKKNPQKCLLSFFEKFNLTRHIKSVHEENKPYRCSICDHNCSLKSSLKTHIESVHEEKTMHKCWICAYQCSKKSNLKRHVESLHENSKTHTCSNCENSFTQKKKFEICILWICSWKKEVTQVFNSRSVKSSLKSHFESVHEKKKCSICDFSFYFKSDMKRHFYAVHAEKKPHRCSLGHYSFLEQGSLKRHIESVHTSQENEITQMLNLLLLITQIVAI